MNERPTIEEQIDRWEIRRKLRARRAMDLIEMERNPRWYWFKFAMSLLPFVVLLLVIIAGALLLLLIALGVLR